MKKEMKKWLCVVSSLLVCVMLTGCGHEHTWADATCTEPKNCSECGETEGEALGHTWVEATCAETKHCSVCGETEGEALEHAWIDANYQTPKTCSECGETEGEPLVASFEEHGLVINVEEGVTYDYVTGCSEDTSKTTIGHAVFSDYRIVEEDTDLGLEKKDGYEWRMVHISILLDDANAWDYGGSAREYPCDYYDIEGGDESERDDEDTNRSYYTVNYNGIEYECCMIRKAGWNDWVDHTVTFEADYYVNVPAGYDGVVLSLYNSQNIWEDGMHVYDVADEDTLFFRMD